MLISEFPKKMTLRDRFAMHALTGLLAKTRLEWRNDLDFAAQLAYRMADAMLKERNQNANIHRNPVSED